MQQKAGARRAHAHDDHGPAGHAHDDHGHHDHAHEEHAHEERASGADDHAAAPKASGPRRPPALTGSFTPRERRQARRLVMVLVITSIFFVLELIGAKIAESVVLEADALHLMMDVAALGMSLVAMRLAVRRPTPRFTFGLRRAEPVAALFNAGLVLAATVEIVREAVEQLESHQRPKADEMLFVAIAALVVNGISAWLLHGAIHQGHDHHGHGHGHGHGHHAPGQAHPAHPRKAHGHALNLRGAWLHLLGDTLCSFAALIAALVIRFGGPSSVDPIASFLVAAILVLGAIRLIRDAIVVLLEAAPVHLPVSAIREVIRGFPGVLEVHDLHVWTLGAGHDAITAHVRLAEPDAAIASRLSDHLRTAFEVEYVTVQIELDDAACIADKARGG